MLDKIESGAYFFHFYISRLPIFSGLGKDSSVVSFWPIDPMVNGSNPPPPPAKLPLRVARVASKYVKYFVSVVFSHSVAVNVCIE